jgi:hypothetical protein
MRAFLLLIAEKTNKQNHKTPSPSCNTSFQTPICITKVLCIHGWRESNTYTYALTCVTLTVAMPPPPAFAAAAACFPMIISLVVMNPPGRRKT